MSHFVKLISMICIFSMLLCCLASCGDGSSDTHAIPTEPSAAEKVHVTVSETENGVMTVSKRGEVAEGTEITVRVIPDDGYKAETLTVNGADILSELDGDTYVFEATEDTVLAATFSARSCAVTGSVTTFDGDYGNVSVTLISAENIGYKATVDAVTGTYRAEVPVGTYTVKAQRTYFNDRLENDVMIVSDKALPSISLDTRSMGDSPLGGKATVNDSKTAVGAFTESCGSYVSPLTSGISVTYFEGFRAEKYILQVDVGAVAADTSQFGSPMPCVVIAQDFSKTSCVYFDITSGKCGLALFSGTSLTKDSATYPFDAEAMKAGYVTVTVVRDGGSVDIYLDGTKVISTTNSYYLTTSAADAGYLASQVVAEYANAVLTTDLSHLDPLLQAAKKTDASSEASRDVDVIIIAGQSNCTGHTSIAYLKQKYPALYDQYKNGFENVYINYVANSYQSYRFTNVRFGQGYVPNHQSNCRFGPEIGMAAYLSETYPDREFYIIKCGFSATGLYEKWASPSATVKGEAKEKFAAFEQYLTDSLEMLKDNGLNPKVLSFCWMQGENDAQAKWVPFYEGYEKALVEDVREILGSVRKGPTVAFVDARISSEKKDSGEYVWTEQERINAAKAAVRDSLPQYNFLFDPQAYGLTCKTESNDNDGYAHYDSESCIRLGRLFAEFSLMLDG